MPPPPPPFQPREGDSHSLMCCSLSVVTRSRHHPLRSTTVAEHSLAGPMDESQLQRLNNDIEAARKEFDSWKGGHMKRLTVAQEKAAADATDNEGAPTVVCSNDSAAHAVELGNWVLSLSFLRQKLSKSSTRRSRTC